MKQTYDPNPLLTRARRDAQADANRDGKPVAIFNLNTVGSPMYVRREPTPELIAARGYVETVQPQ